MPDIKITVRGKIATGDMSRIVCGNSDYSILFDFDAEWDEYDVKTARFVCAGMNREPIDMVFSGAACPVPVLNDTIGVYVGVYAGDLHTTTPAWFECDKSILCGGGSPAAPPDDVYNQIMERLNKLGTPDAEAIAAAVADYIVANPIEEKDPMVPDWAKTAAKPGYTAAEVGADPSGTAASQVSAHNAETTAHSDIRLLIHGLTDRLNALADSDDTTLDQLSEIVAFIKSNRDLIAAVTTDKVSVSDIVDNLTTNVANAPLSAAQGVALKALVDALDAVSVGAIPAPATAQVGQTIRVSAVDETGQPTEWEAVDMASGGISWRKICSIKLTEDVTYIEIDEDENGNPFLLRNVMAFGVTYGVTDDTTGGRSAYMTLYNASGKSFDASYTKPGVPAYGGSRGICLTAMLIPSDRIIGYGWNSSDSGSEASVVSRKAIWSYDQFRGPITKIRLAAGSYGTGYGSGTTLEIYGVNYA